MQGNTTTTLLGISETFTGVSQPLHGDLIHCTVVSDQASSASGWIIQQSNDNSTWVDTATSTYAGSSAVSVLESKVHFKFGRVKYTNTSTAQSSFSLYTLVIENNNSTLSTKGDVLTYDTTNVRLPVGSNDQVLTADSSEATGLKWAASPAASTLTTKGDVLSYDTALARLAVGSNDQVLTADSAQATGLKWAAATDSTLTTKGDVLTYDSANARLGVGSNNQVLTADSAQATGLKWAAATDSTLTTKGDVLTYDSANARLGVGSDGQVLTADSAEATGIKWAATGSFDLNKVVTVGAANCDYTSIQSAIDSISDNSDSNRYTVLVSPGRYDIYDDLITCKSYVSIIGVDRELCELYLSSDPAATFNMITCTSVTNLSIKNLTLTFTSSATPGTNYTVNGISLTSPGVNTIRIQNCNISITSTSNSASSWFAEAGINLLSGRMMG